MVEKRNEDLKRIIEAVYPQMINAVDAKNNRVIIGGKGQRVDQCSFKEVSQVFYTNLLKYTFSISGTVFVDKNGKEYKGFNRQTAVDNALKYLNSFGINIECTLYCESERALFAQFINQIFNGILSVMFSFGDKFNKEAYEKKLISLKTRYNRKIITEGIISLIYSNAKWSNVERYKENKECVDCLLIDTGSDWREYFEIQHINSCIKLKIKSDTEQLCNSLPSFQRDKEYAIKDKRVSKKNEPFLNLDFLHLDYEFFIPNKFCYYTCFDNSQAMAKGDNDNTVTSNLQIPLTTENMIHTPEYGGYEFYKAIDILKNTYGNNKQRQYMNSLIIISKVISALLRTKYKEFYKEKAIKSNSFFISGYKQLRYFFEDNGIGYTEEESSIIYKYLLTLWLDRFRRSLDFYKFEEMFDLYSTKEEDKVYRECIEKYKKEITKYSALDVLDNADEAYQEFYSNNKELIESFEKKVTVVYNDSLDSFTYRNLGDKHTQFKSLKESIKAFQKKLNWEVPYYIEKAYYKEGIKYTFLKLFQGYGHVGDKITITYEADDMYNINAPDSIALSFKENIARIEYRLKNEPNTEQTVQANSQDTIVKDSTVIKFEKGRKYCLKFEASGKADTPFSCIIIRRRNDNSFDAVIEKSDLKLMPSMNQYSFEFVYNGEADDPCYLAWGYGNSVYGYSIRNVKISEIE